MNIEGKTIWQIAAGDGTNTHYAQFCLQHGVIIVGPGRYGAWPDCKMPMLTSSSPRWTPMKVGIIKRFAEDLKPRDIVVLRIGT